MMNTVLDIINKFVPDSSAAKKAAVEIEKEITKQMELQSSIIQAEIKESGIASKWRPYTMIVFVAMVVLHYIMYDVIPFLIVVGNFNIYYPQDPGFTNGLLDLIQLGLMGYIGGRSAEKVARIWRSK